MFAIFLRKAVGYGYSCSQFISYYCNIVHIFVGMKLSALLIVIDEHINLLVAADWQQRRRAIKLLLLHCNVRVEVAFCGSAGRVTWFMAFGTSLERGNVRINLDLRCSRLRIRQLQYPGFLDIENNSLWRRDDMWILQ